MESIKQQLLSKAFQRKNWIMPRAKRSQSARPKSRPSSPDKEKASEEMKRPELKPSLNPHDPIGGAFNTFQDKPGLEMEERIQISEDSFLESETEIPHKASSKKKPVSFLILEHYIREVCSELERTNYICKKTLSRAKHMVNALNDCAKDIPSLSIYFYNLARSLLLDMSEKQEEDEFQTVLQKLLELATFIGEKRYVSKEHPISKYNIYLDEEEQRVSKEALEKRLRNINPKAITILGRANNDNKELLKIAKAFLILLDALDPTLTRKHEGLSTVEMIEKVAQTPNRVYKITQTALGKILQGEISLHIFENIKQTLDSVSLKRLRQNERSGVGVLFYEALTYSIKFIIKEDCPSGNSPVKKRRASVKPTRKRSVPRMSNPKKKCGTPKPYVSPFAPSFADPHKQKMLENIMHQQNINTKFRQFLRNYSKKIQIKNKDLIVEEFARNYKIDPKNCEILKNPREIKKNIDLVKKAKK